MHDWLSLSAMAVALGWILDLLLGDPSWLPHPVVLFGKMIATGERLLNKGRYRRLKGGAMAMVLVMAVFAATIWLTNLFTLHPALYVAWYGILIFYCLAGTTLVREVTGVFDALSRSLGDGRRQVARIVGRDTAQLTAQEVKTAALETLAENLSDGVVAPLFWLALLGVPGMVAYKMVNTLDSMIGYRTERYQAFGCVAARMDDAANYIPARITAFLMLLADLLLSFSYSLLFKKRWPWGCFARFCSNTRFVIRNASHHASPNSGWPEAALAAALGCRFGGPHYYFGQLFPKPFIGEEDRPLNAADGHRAIAINRMAELMAVAVCLLLAFVGITIGY